LFWAFKEAVSNFRYLIFSEEEIQGRRANPWNRIYKIMRGADPDSVDHTTLLLQELGDEPFNKMIDLRAWWLNSKKAR